MFLLAAQTHAAAWTDAQHKKAVLGLHAGDTNVVDGHGNYWARVGRSAMPSLPTGGTWYLHFGSKAFDPDLMQHVVTKPDGAADVPPNSAQALRTLSLSGINVSLHGQVRAWPCSAVAQGAANSSGQLGAPRQWRWKRLHEAQPHPLQGV